MRGMIRLRCAGSLQIVAFALARNSVADRASVFGVGRTVRVLALDPCVGGFGVGGHLVIPKLIYAVKFDARLTHNLETFAVFCASVWVKLLQVLTNGNGFIECRLANTFRRQPFI